jgi:hypothetical protein
MFTAFSALPNDVQVNIVEKFMDQMTVGEQDSYDYEQVCALNRLSRAFNFVTNPWVMEWQGLFENPAEYGDWTWLPNDRISESPYKIGDTFIISTEGVEDDTYAFYYNGHRLHETFDCANGDDSWHLFVGQKVVVKEVHAYTPDPRLTLMNEYCDTSVDVIYVPECGVIGKDVDDSISDNETFLVPPMALT